MHNGRISGHSILRSELIQKVAKQKQRKIVVWFARNCKGHHYWNGEIICPQVDDDFMQYSLILNLKYDNYHFIRMHSNYELKWSIKNAHVTKLVWGPDDIQATLNYVFVENRFTIGQSVF